MHAGEQQLALAGFRYGAAGLKKRPAFADANVYKGDTHDRSRAWRPDVRCGVARRGGGGRNREGDAADSRCPHRVFDELHVPGDPAVYLETGPDVDRMGDRRPGRHLGVQPQRLLSRRVRLSQGLVQAARHQRRACGHHPPPIARQTEGKITLELRFMLPASLEGAAWQLRDLDEGGRGPRRPRRQPELPDRGPAAAPGSAGIES